MNSYQAYQELFIRTKQKFGLLGLKKFHLPSENTWHDKNIDDSLEQSNIY